MTSMLPASASGTKHKSRPQLLHLLPGSVSFICSACKFMLSQFQLLKQIMPVCGQIAVADDEHSEERILVLSQSTTFGECSSDELTAYKTQFLVLLCSPLDENENHEHGKEFERKRFRLELDAFKIQFNCEKDPTKHDQHTTEIPEPVSSLHGEMVLKKGSLQINRENIASEILECVSPTTMSVSSVFQQMGHKKFSYDEWKSRIQRNIADWKFLDSSVTNTTLPDTCLIDYLYLCEKSSGRMELDRIVKGMDELEQKVENLECSLQNLEQNARRNWLVLHGVFEKAKENTLEVMIKVVKEKTGLQINPQDVENCHRMGRKRFRNKADPLKMQQNKRPIVIKFVNYCKRKALWDHKKHLRGSGLLLTESLTNTRLELLQTARELFGEKSVWSQDGRIMYRKADGSKMRINNLEDLELISKAL